MTRLAEIETHIADMSELLEVVGAMRSLAAMRAQEARRAVPGVRRYSETLVAAIGAALLLVPRPPPSRSETQRRTLVLCTAEHGFVGGFDERIISAADAMHLPDDLIFVLGSRGAALLREHRRTVRWAQPMPTRPEAAPEAIRRLSAELFRAGAAGEAQQVDVVFARHRQGASLTVEQRKLFPVEFAELRTERRLQPPLHHLAPQALLERLVADYVFALLIDAAVESIASENAARFAAMETAHDGVSKRLEQLCRDGRLARQDEITAELLDIVTGAEALRGATGDAGAQTIPRA
jgi:F-type H+-transporting ATPase subunit gamma